MRDVLPACFVGRIALLEPVPANAKARRWHSLTSAGKCCYCEVGLSEDCVPTPAHLWPVSSGGAPDGPNIAGLACWRCNMQAGDSYSIGGKRYGAGRIAGKSVPDAWLADLDDGFRVLVDAVAGVYRPAVVADVESAVLARRRHVDSLCECE